jgi:hypothetical protein
MATQDYAASVQGVAVRITALSAAGVPLNTGLNSIVTSAFTRVSFTPEYEEGDEITEKGADGTTCVTFKAPDTLKRVNLEIAICEPDPEITKLLGGGVLLADGSPLSSQGWAAPVTGEDPLPNGVAIEVWSRAIQDGKPAIVNPYYHWVFPYVKTRASGDRVIENGLLATTFEGFGLGNSSFGEGVDERWMWPDVTDRAYMYARSTYAPIGLRGPYTWLAGSPTAVTTFTDPGTTVNDGIYDATPV